MLINFVQKYLQFIARVWLPSDTMLNWHYDWQRAFTSKVLYINCFISKLQMYIASEASMNI
jgi:hypothetical protein